MKRIERLDAALLRRAESKGKAQGWYTLCRRGYFPAEIAIYAEPVVGSNDVVYRVRQYAELHDLPVPVSCARRRERGIAPPPEDWRAAFRSTVMRTGMCLALTQPMLEYLCAVADGVQWDRQLIGGSSLARPCNSIATSASLAKRGLIIRKSGVTVADLGNRDSWEELTDAGKAVVELLKSVGVFVQADESISRKSAKIGKRRAS